MNPTSNTVLTKPELNLVAKLQSKYGIVVDLNDNTTVELHNRFTGFAVQTTKFVAALYHFTISSIMSYEMSNGNKMTYNGVPVAIGTYDRVRYLILKLDRKAYSELVD